MSEYTDQKQLFYAANPTYWSLNSSGRSQLMEKAGFHKASRCMALLTEAGKHSLWMAHANCAGFCRTLSAEELDRELAAREARRYHKVPWYLKLWKKLTA